MPRGPAVGTKTKTRSADAEGRAKSHTDQCAPSNGLVSGLHEWRGHTRDGTAWEVHRGDVCKVLTGFSGEEFDCVVTSPPYYWQRDYKVLGQIGQEATILGYVDVIADAMEQVRRVLKKDGLLFLNLGDTYYSAKGQPKG